MRHLGDITQLRGRDVPPVDVVTGGSPCQDLSIAGRREGLAGERSGLFMEQIRLIREMREEDKHRGRTAHLIRPRFMVWENVPGAFSSNKGEDFRAVLEETARIADEDAVVPGPPKGKWPTVGAIVGDGWSLAWRVFDAQFWGVPQRRRRIALVADFGGLAAPEVLFERKGVCGDPGTGEEAGQAPSARAGRGAGGAVTVRIRGGCEGGGKGALVQWEQSGTLGCGNDQTLICLNDQGGSCLDVTENITGTLRAQAHGHQPIVVAGFKPRQGAKAGSIGYAVEVAPTLNAEQITAVYENHGQDGRLTGPLCVAPTVSQKFGTGGNNTPLITNAGTVRRLTPLESERLQGYPDGWTGIGDWMDCKGKRHREADSPRYRAIGNSIALPPWRWVLLRITAQYTRPATLASLFDGIGGFPLIWERMNGPGTALWASEVEGFPIAVTRARFWEVRHGQGL